jgi:hypothetical protein
MNRDVSVLAIIGEHSSNAKHPARLSCFPVRNLETHGTMLFGINVQYFKRSIIAHVSKWADGICSTA